MLYSLDYLLAAHAAQECLEASLEGEDLTGHATSSQHSSQEDRCPGPTVQLSSHSPGPSW